MYPDHGLSEPCVFGNPDRPLEALFCMTSFLVIAFTGFKMRHRPTPMDTCLPGLAKQATRPELAAPCTGPPGTRPDHGAVRQAAHIHPAQFN